MKKILAITRAYFYGIRDGFSQPYEVSSSRNVDHLHPTVDDPWSIQDTGINHGQFLRAGRSSEAYREGLLRR